MNLTYLTLAIFATTTKCTVVSASSSATNVADWSDVSDAEWNDEATKEDNLINYNHRSLQTSDPLATNDPLAPATGDDIIESELIATSTATATSTGDYSSAADAKTALCWTDAQFAEMASDSCDNVPGDCETTVTSSSCTATVARRRQLFRSVGSRNLQTTTTYEVKNAADLQTVIKLYVSSNTDPSVITQLQATLTAQITTSTTAAVQTVTASCPAGATCQAAAIAVVVSNPVAQDLTRWYPKGWKHDDAYCNNDGEYELYMLKNNFLSSSLEACCKRYYGWDREACLVAGGQAAAESGEYVVNYEKGFCYQDCLKVGSSLGAACTNPADELPQSWQTKYKDAASCCKGKLWWEPQEECIAKSEQGENAVVTYVGSLKWYRNSEGSDCVQDCAEDAGDACVPTEGDWEKKWNTLTQCCKQHFDWLEVDAENCKTARSYTYP